MHLSSLNQDAQPLRGQIGLKAHLGRCLRDAFVDLLYDKSNPSETFSPHGRIISTQGRLPLAGLSFSYQDFRQHPSQRFAVGSDSTGIHSLGEVLALCGHCVHTAHTEAGILTQVTRLVVTVLFPLNPFQKNEQSKNIGLLMEAPFRYKKPSAQDQCFITKR